MNWPTCLLKEEASVITKGTTPTTLGYKFAREGVPFLRAQNLVNGTVSVSADPLFISEEVHDALNRSKIRPRDILISIAGTIGRAAVVPDDAPEMNCNQAVAIVRPSSSIDSRYLLHWLSGTDAFSQVSKSKVTGVISNLSLGQIGLLSVPLPPLDEQRRIAEILDKADAIRRKRELALDLADEFLKSAYVHTVGHLNPAHGDWEPFTIEQLAEDRKGSIRSGPFGSALRHGEFVEQGIAVLGIDNAVQNRFAWGGRRFITEGKYEQLRRYTVFPNDVIITIMGTTGRSAVVPEDIPDAITTKHLATITCDTSLIHPEVLSFAIHSDPMIIQQIRSHNKGAIMDGLNLGIIRKLVINRPPMEEQLRFVSILRKIRSMNERTDKPELNGESLFDSLSQRAFRGEL